MSHRPETPAELREKFWRALEDSPYVMLQLDADPASLSPMTAQLDRDGNHNIWFYTSRLGAFAMLGDATAVFVGKDHNIFARFDGVLSEETDPAIFEKHWSRSVQAWFPGGKKDPNLMMIRMSLGEASIWSTGELGLLGGVKMMLGMDVRQEAQGGHITTRI